MRVASSQYQSLINISLQQNQERINYLTQQMASGLRIQLPSDDPIGNVRISRLTREQAMVTQYQDNIATVKVRLLKNENYLSSMVTDMGQARDLLVWAADGSNAPDDLNAMTQSLINISLQQNQERINYLTQQMASGLRIQLPSDDPIGNVRISRLTREQAMVTQYQDNIATV